MARCNDCGSYNVKMVGDYVTGINRKSIIFNDLLDYKLYKCIDCGNSFLSKQSIDIHDLPEVKLKT